jgi:hypothetical protein
LATGLLTTDAGIAATEASMPVRARMLVTAAPATKKQVSAMIVIALVKPGSLPMGLTASQHRENLALIKATSRRW